jgi:agmatinase
LVLPVPYEATTTYQQGAADGPAAVIAASAHVETYDEELDSSPCACGIATLPPLTPRGAPEDAIDQVRKAVAAWAAPGRLVVTLGGEHTIAAGAVAAHLSAFEDVGVIQFDAHADLRPSYMGSRWNHACTMARIRDQLPPDRVIQYGVRSMSAREADDIRQHAYTVVPAHAIHTDLRGAARLIPDLPPKVYITFDVDVFDPSVVRATGTPEPGGLSWFETCDLLRDIFARRQVVGFDITEICAGDTVSAFTIARLLYRMVGWWAESRLNVVQGGRP